MGKDNRIRSGQEVDWILLGLYDIKNIYLEAPSVFTENIFLYLSSKKQKKAPWHPNALS